MALPGLHKSPRKQGQTFPWTIVYNLIATDFHCFRARIRSSGVVDVDIGLAFRLVNAYYRNHMPTHDLRAGAVCEFDPELYRVAVLQRATYSINGSHTMSVANLRGTDGYAGGGGPAVFAGDKITRWHAVFRSPIHMPLKIFYKVQRIAGNQIFPAVSGHQRNQTVGSRCRRAFSCSLGEVRHAFLGYFNRIVLRVSNRHAPAF